MITSNQPREFFVWVEPSSFGIQHNLGLVASFSDGRFLVPVDGPDGLIFVPNPNAQARERSLTPFHLGITRDYRVEYNLEALRYREFSNLPSRFKALYLLESRVEAERYKQAEPGHVSTRILKRGVTSGEYSFSTHDSAWIKFLRLPHSIDEETFLQCGRAYWQSQTISGIELCSMGKCWTAPSVTEVLFYGTIEFPNKALTSD